VVERVLEREDAAPRLAVQLHAPESELRAYCLELVDERGTTQSDGSQGRSERPLPKWS
jgi:hypothetical protein